MRTIITLMAIVLLPGFILAQETPLSALYANYMSEPGFETNEILPGSTSYEWEKNINSEYILALIKDIESVRFMEYKGEGKLSTDKVWKKLTGAAQDDAYTEVVNVRGDVEQAGLYLMKGSDGLYREIALLAREEDSVTMITITGIIDMKKIFSPETFKNLREFRQYYMKDKGACEVR